MSRRGETYSTAAEAAEKLAHGRFYHLGNITDEPVEDEMLRSTTCAIVHATTFTLTASYIKPGFIFAMLTLIMSSFKVMDLDVRRRYCTARSFCSFTTAFAAYV